MNCDFSGKNNIWARFYEFLVLSHSDTRKHFPAALGPGRQLCIRKVTKRLIYTNKSILSVCMFMCDAG